MAACFWTPFVLLRAVSHSHSACYNVRAFPECSNDWLPRARWNTRNARFANVLTCLLFRYFSRFENCLQTFFFFSFLFFFAKEKEQGRKRFHPLWQTCDFETVINIVDHITLACGSIIMLKNFLSFLICALRIIHILYIWLF